MSLPIDSNKVSKSQIGYPVLVTVEEAAGLLRIGRTTAYELVMSGKLQIGQGRSTSSRSPRWQFEDYVGELLRTSKRI